MEGTEDLHHDLAFVQYFTISNYNHPYYPFHCNEPSQELCQYTEIIFIFPEIIPSLDYLFLLDV